MMQHVSTSLRTAAVTIVLTVAYTLVVTAVAQLLLSRQADGSVITDQRGGAVGSELIGQTFTDAAYVHSRPSAAGGGYDAAASSGSNLGTTSAALRERVSAAVEKLRAANPDAPGPVPAELVTASGSGLDPHISPAAAEWQIPRIAAARKVAVERVRAVVAEHVEGRALGLFGEPRVNVLRLNRAMDQRFGPPRGGANMSPK
ncbi:MAG: Potassium-transporting ATPase KdpC subunit [Planctomycetes bacterium]|nr:Potassium-transporting ATPase KdpC subunit [Planctomycetota bacterium]